MQEVEDLAKYALVGKFMHILISLVFVTNWCITSGTELFLGYMPRINVMING